ncbi:hypothetical protein FHU41_000159 [Psychromicrobium silvestre]|uniref:Activator of Hsp90 ATPase homologue 1/2-like C-terminal domain-containing protein n=1 Tax=Psychromicrobium silvestre TaxID=1645614 RepID=A0A7Y9LQW6_9MICC|nr:SRPBCC domain-containing protein [Psychromicrobium silvestre]NYE93938.1 hypothetical protein [Psychromicrobium silvestre]
MAQMTGHRETENGADWMVLERQLSGDLAASWRVVTDSASLDRFIGRWEGDPASGQVDFYMTAEGSTDANTYRVLECTPQQRYVVESEYMGMVWQLAISLRTAENGTTLRFAQRYEPDMDAASIGPGWEYYLDRLVAAEAGEDVNSVLWDDYYPALSEDYRAI